MSAVFGAFGEGARHLDIAASILTRAKAALAPDATTAEDYRKCGNTLRPTFLASLRTLEITYAASAKQARESGAFATALREKAIRAIAEIQEAERGMGASPFFTLNEGRIRMIVGMLLKCEADNTPSSDLETKRQRYEDAAAAYDGAAIRHYEGDEQKATVMWVALQCRMRAGTTITLGEAKHRRVAARAATARAATIFPDIDSKWGEDHRAECEQVIERHIGQGLHDSDPLPPFVRFSGPEDLVGSPEEYEIMHIEKGKSGQ